MRRFDQVYAAYAKLLDKFGMCVRFEIMAGEVKTTVAAGS